MPRAHHHHNSALEIHFDEHARRDFLTGFHKRKQERTEAARKRAQDREKQQRLKFRREQRQALREQAKQNAKQIESSFGGAPASDSDEAEWGGISPPDIHQEEYEDAEILASVTVEEDFDPQGTPHSPQREKIPEPPQANSGTFSRPRPSSVAMDAFHNASNHSESQSRLKPPTFKYQTKAARSAERTKQKRRHTEKAERAGGKASTLNRKTKHRRGKQSRP